MEACPCCKNKTLPTRGDFDLCPVCFWEDDGNNDPDADPGPNRVSLRISRENYSLFGACDIECKTFVRKPTSEEAD